MTTRVPPNSPEGEHESPTQGGAGERGARKSGRGPLGRRLQGLPDRERRSPKVVAFTILLHVVVVAAFIQVIPMGYGLSRFMSFKKRDTPQERLTFVTPTETPRPAVAERPRQVRDVAPSTAPTPNALPPAATPSVATPIRPAPGDTGSRPPAHNGVGALDPNVRGVRPGYNDERVWRGPVGSGGGGGGGVQGDRADNIGEMMRGVLMAAQDSVDSLARARGQTGRQPGDWTKTDGNGNRWGWDQQGIRLGKVTIPNALLGLLPMNAATAAQFSANPSAMSSAARLSQSRADIQRMSARGIGEAEFRRVVKEMDARRDTERRERLRAPSASVAAPVRTADSKEPPR
ncbi:MAG: hypothetical protein IBJ03_17055 [Gemmatimonadaceae bacterium]|nr:hypothetical protein [Gemmatimonadaceae bacterium]